MIIVFYLGAILLIFFSLKSFLGGIEYLRFFRRELARPESEFRPFVSVIAPCRGLDHGLAENLRALTTQTYPDLEIIFVVDNDNDPAVAAIENLRQETDRSTKLVIAPAADRSSQKVENLREAVLHTSDRSEVFVFVDSDVRPSPDWLASLVAPLADANVGAATGYRWFISPRPTFGSEMRSVWNASIASALGPNIESNFCWGGSMAVRRDVFDRVEMRKKWRGTLSDDFAVTHTIKAAGLPIVFVPRALTASVEGCSLREMLEFTTRQMKITRVYAPPLWKLSFFGSGLFNAVMIAALMITIFSRVNNAAVWVSIMTLALVSTFSVCKSALRLAAVQLVLTGYKADLKRQFWTQNTLWLLAPTVFFYNAFAALVSRRMTWRGIRYELKSPHETVIIADEKGGKSKSV